MTSNSVSGLLNAVLDPLVSITEQVEAALALARRNRLPPSFIQTIKASAATLDGITDTLTDIAVTLDPSLAKDQD